MKIECAERHFGVVDVDYDVVSTAETFREKVLENQRRD
jgi:hypothetical protein